MLLDHTSSTSAGVRVAVETCLQFTPAVLLVNAAVKHDQCGADFNPYGELRIVARDSAELECDGQQLVVGVYEHMLAALEAGDPAEVASNRVPGAVNCIAAAYRAAGLAFSMRYVFASTRGPCVRSETEFAQPVVGEPAAAFAQRPPSPPVAHTEFMRQLNEEGQPDRECEQMAHQLQQLQLENQHPNKMK